MSENSTSPPPSPASSEAPLRSDLFDLDPEILWVMHCAEGPVPRAAVDAVRRALDIELKPWTLAWPDDFEGPPRATRAAAARVLGARQEDITLTATTSTGLIAVAQGYPWRHRDEIIAPVGEFPTNYWPWRALQSRGPMLRERQLWDDHRSGLGAWTSAPPVAGMDFEAPLLASLEEQAAMMTVSWVRFQDGLKLDLRRLAEGCAERGVDLVVDGIQGAGTLVPDLEGVAAFATGGHKGLLAPQGLGILWTSPELREKIAPSGSWLSVEDATNFDRPNTDFNRDWLANGERLEAGVPNLLGCAALSTSLELLAEVGVERIAAHVASLRARLLDGLESAPAWSAEVDRLRALDAADRLGSIVALHHGGRGPQKLDEILRSGFDRGIHASVRDGYLRIAFHGWHTAEDADRVAEWLGDVG